MNKLHIPVRLADERGKIWTLDDVDLTDKKCPLTYIRDGSKCGLMMVQADVETDFTRAGRPEPKGNIVVQGRYECAAAALAMLLGEKLFHVKRAMGQMQWRNDDGGASDEIMIGAGRILGRDMIRINRHEIKEDIGPCTITLPSINIPGMFHAVTWTGEEILDPNWGREGRKFWGCEWAPWTIGARGALVLLKHSLTEAERAEYDEVVRAREEKEIAAIKNAILTALKEAS